MSLQLQKLYLNMRCLSNQPKNVEMSFLRVGSFSINNWYQSAAIQPCTHVAVVPVTWDSSDMLRLSGNIGINPRPRHLDENQVYCIIYLTTIKQDIPKEAAPSCPEIKWQLRYLEDCNRLTVAQTRHSKYSVDNIIWKCHKHCTSIAKIVVPPPPFFRWPTRPSAAGKLCSVCSAPIWPLRW